MKSPRKLSFQISFYTIFIFIQKQLYNIQEGEVLFFWDKHLLSISNSFFHDPVNQIKG